MDSSYQSDILNETIDETDVKNERFNRATSFQFSFGENSRDIFVLGDGGFDEADEIDDVVYQWRHNTFIQTFIVYMEMQIFFSRPYLSTVLHIMIYLDNNG